MVTEEAFPLMPLEDGVEQYRSEAGGLGVIHFRDLTFTPRRIYWLFDTPVGLERGWHAHKSLEQYLLCLSGQVQVELDNGDRTEIHELHGSTPGIHITPGHWRILRNMNPETIVLVLASEDYEPSDYIFDYEEFKAWTRGT